MPDGNTPLTDALPLLLTDPVVLRDGAQHLRLQDGRTAPLRTPSGEPITEFVAGWSPALLYTGLAPFLVLEFSGPDGQRAAWLLDPGLRHLGDTLAELAPEPAQALRGQSVPLLRRMLTDILIRPMPVLSPESLAFLALDEALRLAIARAGGEIALAAPALRLIDEIEESVGLPSPPDTGAMPHSLSRAHLRAGFETKLEDRLLDPACQGMLCWPSPVDGRALRCQGCLYIDDFRFAYRFADGPANLAFYVIASEHYFQPLGIYVPALDLLVARDARARHLLEVLFPPDLSHWLVEQVARRAAAMVSSLRRGAARIASVMRGPPGTHLGHQLWNELSGIEYLLSRSDGAAIPQWIIPGARHGVELWAPTDRLFPELRDRIHRGLDTEADVAAYVYAEDICAVRITREHVSAELRRRLAALARRDPGQSAIDAYVERSRERHAPVIVLGLRVENRTLVDIEAFFADAIGLIARSWPGATVILDGHNTQSAGAIIESHGEMLATRGPLEIERGIATSLRAGAAGLDVTIVDTLGASLAVSIAWALRCDCFLSVWGASLAKFRWVCNKPGLVLSSRANLLHRDDLHIYEDPRYMEDPSRLVYADPASVVDDPGAPLLIRIGVPNRFFANFRVDHERVLGQFGTLVKEVMTAR